MRHAQDADVLDGITQPEGQAPDSAASTRRSSSITGALIVAAVVIFVDQITKSWALNTLTVGSCSQPDTCIDLFAGIKFRLVFNTGAAFTTGSGFGPLLAVLAFVMAGVLFVMASKRQDRWGAMLLGAIAGGAIGNLIDRVFRADDGLFSGAVVDFIDLGWWPVFNIADSAIVVGVIAVIVGTFFERDPQESESND
ncbi:MAG: signal peptidase II [Acidimicrobiales bacterium]